MISFSSSGFPENSSCVKSMEKMVNSCVGFERGRPRHGGSIDSVTEFTSESSASSSSGVASSYGSFAEGREAVAAVEEGSVSSPMPSSPPLPSKLLGWPLGKTSFRKSSGKKKMTPNVSNLGFKRLGTEVSEIELLKERMAKLLLGEDMSGAGDGVCSAQAISNAITNLSSTILGQLWRLEALPSEKKSLWRREIEVLLCVSDHIVEFVPSFQNFPNGSKVEVMACRQRSDLFTCLPALRKLDNMLLEILDSFVETEFWYVDQGGVTPGSNGSDSFREQICGRQDEDKWWLPLPRVPPCGLSEESRKRLNHTREFTNQILKACMAINSIALSEMEIPRSYIDALPKSGRSCLGDFLYRNITSQNFSAEVLVESIEMSSENEIVDLVNRVEASIYIWRRIANPKRCLISPYGRSISTRSSWGMMNDNDKREILAGRAESLLVCLKRRFPGLRQTSLDISKIECNKDIGKAILESYSRVLESLAYNVGVRIDELLYLDDIAKDSDKIRSVSSKAGWGSQRRLSDPLSVSFSGTPYRSSSFPATGYSPMPLISPMRGEITPFLSSKNIKERRGLRVRKALAYYLWG